MKNTIMAVLILVPSLAGVSFAGDNNTGNAPNPPTNEVTGPNANMDNSDTNSDTNAYTNTTTNGQY